MNHLAHLQLSDGPDERLGNLLGDHVRGRLQPGDWPPGVYRGLHLHRRIDSLADHHPAARTLRARFPNGERRCAGILLDLCHDHFLIRHWTVLQDQPLADWVRRVYRELADRRPDMPAPLQQRLPTLIERDWLRACSDLEGVERVLARVAGRLRRPEPLLRAGARLRQLYPDLERCFLALYPDIRASVAHERVRVRDGWCAERPPAR
ncbi:ACP phosphodiesterase [Alkalilimnicola ehrlichii MLHE-1]|uniref:Acyl carrier protein phosphodiesterase n=1 Tax=Alkalilimnicola ehrlichii (strain ATCC BAA-1101 / DSM 17681 / MLHE-1) TaxID=187272 RepID=Q0A6X4_ALKEH|nr:ACP phosphodiesterase [Alkalilimnicola ehrlichii]ABI57413.1 protein of unknown function DUF479 [Alkalilimnicola ehrlichii MLHE-1]